MSVRLAAILLLACAGAANAAPQGSCDRAAFRTILDVGHTSEDPGAISARGGFEYEFNLRLAKLIDQRLRDSGFAKTTVLVTAGQAKPALYKRVRDANRLGGDLFLSIHHDAVPDWFVEYWDHEGKQQKFSDRFKGHSLFVSNGSSNLRQGLAFAKTLGAELKQRGLQYAQHYTEPFMKTRRRVLLDAENGVYRFDELLVLKTTNMPAVLLEAGNILNRDEEREMGTPERQETIAQSVVAAIETYCGNGRAPNRPAFAKLKRQRKAARTVAARPRPAATAASHGSEGI